MNFVSAIPLVQPSREKGYAVPALNTNGATYDITRAAIEAVQELNSPLILQVYEPNTEYRGFEYFVSQAEFLCRQLKVTVPVALQVDHGHSFESLEVAMRAGFTSVMFDASHDPIEENIEKTKQVIRRARELGVSVEAEIGYVKGNEPKKEKLIGRIPVSIKPTIEPAKTDPAEAERFVNEVAVDMLAVSVGTIHGVYQHQTEIDFDLLAELREKISVPLVQHGTSGISLEDLAKLARSGMAKINFGEPFRFNYIKYFNQLTDEMEHLWHPWRIMRQVKDLLKADMKELIIAIGATDKA